jgi:C1A family cysteine protease
MNKKKELEIESLSVQDIPKSVDWRTKGAVTPIKDQGQCGSCWAFSSTGSMESAHFIKTGNTVILSEEQLVECSWLDMGCNGGNPMFAFEFAESHPLETEADYPYTAPKVNSCSEDKAKEVVKVTDWHYVLPLSSDQLKANVARTPVSVSLRADHPVFHQYTGGIITQDCGTVPTDHAVLVVGYGADETGLEYYIVKNSWGEAYGEKGYVRVAITGGLGTCGIQFMPMYPETN